MEVPCAGYFGAGGAVPLCWCHVEEEGVLAVLGGTEHDRGYFEMLTSRTIARWKTPLIRYGHALTTASTSSIPSTEPETTVT